jgi:hypothetical protein
MTTTTIDEFVSQINELADADRAELLRRLNEPPRKNDEPKKTKTNGKKGYVSPDTIWMRDHSHKYAGMYVAIKDGAFVAAGRTIKDADIAAREKGVDRPLLAYVNRKDEELWGGW